jgi:hypothetical protein
MGGWPGGLVFDRNRVGVINDQGFDRFPGRYQLEAKLFFHRFGEKRRNDAFLGGVEVIRGERQSEGEITFESGSSRTGLPA